MKAKFSRLIALVTLATACAIAVAQAQALVNYSVNTDATDGQGNVIGEGVVPASTLEGVGGLGAGTTWNQGGYTNIPASLLDSTGASSGISFTTTNFDRRRTDADVDITPDPDTDLTIFRNYALKDGGAGRGATVDLTFTGLTNGGTYDIWLYVLRDPGTGNEAFGQTITTTNTTASISSQIVDNNAAGVNDSTFIENGNYVFFDDVVADGSGEIDFTFVGKAAGDVGGFVSTTSGLRPGLNGFQILEATSAGPDPATSTVTTSPTSVPADGTTISTVTVTLKGATNIPVSGRDVSLAGSTGNAAITVVSGTTDSNGEATFTVASSTIETETFTATDVTGGGSIVVTQTADVVFFNPVPDAGLSTVAASPASVPADGSTPSTITVTLNNASGIPTPNRDVSLSGSTGNATITVVSGTTDVNGEATFTVASNFIETETFTATDVTGGGSIVVTQTADVQFLDSVPTAAQSTVVAIPTVVAADGSATSTITVTMLNSGSNPVSDRDVSLNGSTGNATITVVSGTTDVNGEATFTVASNSIETETFTATDVTGGGSIVVTQTADVDFFDPLPTAANSTVVAAPTSVPADGTTTSTITVTLLNGGDEPVSSRTVSLSGSTGGAAITVVSGTTDVNGEATFTVASSTIETETFTATDTTGGGSIVVTQTADVTFTNPNIVLINYSVETIAGQGNIGGTDQADPDPATLVGVTGGTGLTWNQGGYTNVAADLLDSAGGSTGISFTTSGFTEMRNPNIAVGTQPIFTAYGGAGGGAGRGATIGLTFTGLTDGGAYDIWLIGSRFEGNTAENISSTVTTSNTTASSSTQYLDNNSGSNSNTAFVAGANYVFFDDVVADGSGEIAFSLTGATVGDVNFTAMGNNQRPGLSGFQIQYDGSTSPSTPFDTWAESGTVTGVTFEGDANGDGVQDGLAFLLGAPTPDEDANPRLPAATEDGSGGLVMTFNCLPTSERGPAELRVEHSSDLGVGDPWLATVDQVPDADDPTSDNGVTFVVTSGPVGPPALNSVTATISSTEADGGKLFGSLDAIESSGGGGGG